MSLPLTLSIKKLALYFVILLNYNIYRLKLCLHLGPNLHLEISKMWLISLKTL